MPKTVPARFVLGVAADVAEALAILHGQLGVAHGDVYAHNVLVDAAQAGPLPTAAAAPSGAAGAGAPRYAELFDYGAAFFYAPAQRGTVEPVEVCARWLSLPPPPQKKA